MNCPVCRDSGIIRFDGSLDRSKMLSMSEMLAQCDACKVCGEGEKTRVDFRKWRHEWSKPL